MCYTLLTLKPRVCEINTNIKAGKLTFVYIKPHLLSVLGNRAIALTRTHIYSVKIYIDYVIVLYIYEQSSLNIYKQL